MDEPTAPPAPDTEANAERRWSRVGRRLVLQAGAQLSAFVIAMALLLGLLALLGYDPGVILNALWTGSVGSTAGLGASIENAVPDVLAATAVWLAFRGGLINIGADGQLQIGGLTALVTVLAMPRAPAPVLILVGLVAGMAGGLVWAAIAAALRVLRGANEIISTIMLNFIAFISITALINGPLLDRSSAFTTATKQIPPGAQLAPVLSIDGNITWAILLAMSLCIAIIVFVLWSDIGLRLSAIGLNREAAQHAGVPVRRYWFTSFSISGALCGLGGALVVLGSRYYLAPGWAEPWGLYGVLVAFLSLRSPLLIPLWSFVFGMLIAAGPILKASAGVPDAITVMMQTLPVVVLYVLYAVARAVRRRRRTAAVAVEAGG